MSEAEHRQYTRGQLERRDLLADPYSQLTKWLDDATRSVNPEPRAMTLATVSLAGRPSARVVLLRELTDESLVFYTDYRSRKGEELERLPFGAVTFFWPELERQVRAAGRVARLSIAESEDYFSHRPRRSQIASWASHQSAALEGRETLEKDWDRVENAFSEVEVPLPPCWGGYALFPDEFEFWQGRRDRMHDRFAYRPHETSWQITRLAP